MRLPSKPYSTLPIYSLGPGAVAKEEASAASAPAEPEKHPFGSGHSRHSLRRSVYKYVTVVLYSPFFLYTDERWFKMPCFVKLAAHYFFPSSGCLSTAAVAAAKMAGHRTSQSCPRSLLRTGSPWRSALTAKSSSQRSSPPASATCAWPASVPVSIAKPSPSTCHRLARSTSCPLSAPSTRCRKWHRLVCFTPLPELNNTMNHPPPPSSKSSFDTDWFTVTMKPVHPTKKLVKVLIPYPVSGKVGTL